MPSAKSSLQAKLAADSKPNAAEILGVGDYQAKHAGDRRSGKREGQRSRSYARDVARTDLEPKKMCAPNA